MHYSRNKPENGLIVYIMQLKNYQQKALEQLDLWIDALKDAVKKREKAKEFFEELREPIPKDLQNYPRSAWGSLKDQGVLPGIEQDGDIKIPDYISRTGTSGEPIPHVCMKIPTGGGKTLLGVASLERLRREKGFVLWIVPTKAIYEQTIKSFRNREHPYRVMLERISGGKVKLLEKDDRFTKQDVESYLCIMMLMLPSANRKKGKDFLKIFRDSSGYTSFFPEQDDLKENKQLSEDHTDLEKNKSGGWVKHSLINVLKLIRPTVILDEAHKAYGRNEENNREFVQSVNRLNPRFVLELSATPRTGISNILVNIGGTELKNEEMIKLPIEIHSFSNSDWKRTLAQTQKKLNDLEQEARKLKQRENRYVRPIVVVRVQRTSEEGNKQGKTYSEDARNYLIQNLSVPERQVKVQSSTLKELGGEDLLSEMSEVRWIITKDALKEGWDCSFAYILALLDNTTATTAITQMTGRVMRQPHARLIDKSDALNRCYIYCYNRDVGIAVEGVKQGLEQEGLTGLGDSVIDGGKEANVTTRTIKRREPYRKLNIFLPQVLHKDGRKWRPIDYDRDILASLNWGGINARGAVELDDNDTIAERTAVVDIQGEHFVSETKIDTGEVLTLDYFVRRLIDMVPNPWQAARMAKTFLRSCKRKNRGDLELLKNRLYLSEVLRERIRENIDGKAEQVFREKICKDEIRFHLVTDEKLNYEFQKTLEVSVAQDETALAEHGNPVQSSLFENAFESDFNGLEKNFALYLEKNDSIFWWHKIAARQEYSIQGWKRHKVYPDFVAFRKGGGKESKLLIMETKGIHLKGNEDTAYKQKLLQTLDATYKTALERGEMKTVGKTPAKFSMLFENEWREKVDEIIAEV